MTGSTKRLSNKKAVEILRYAECLDNIDDDVATMCISIIPKKDELMSLSDLSYGMQRIKDKLKRRELARVREKIMDFVNDCDIVFFDNHPKKIIQKLLQKHFGVSEEVKAEGGKE